MERLGFRVWSLPSSMLLPEQMGWTFHRVCMKEASTWMLPLEMDKCCRKEGMITCSIYLFATATQATVQGLNCQRVLVGKGGNISIL